jgi:hypothetical protein
MWYEDGDCKKVLRSYWVCIVAVFKKKEKPGIPKKNSFLKIENLGRGSPPAESFLFAARPKNKSKKN